MVVVVVVVLLCAQKIRLSSFPRRREEERRTMHEQRMFACFIGGGEIRKEEKSRLTFRCHNGMTNDGDEPHRERNVFPLLKKGIQQGRREIGTARHCGVGIER